jgi:hypothetical protein
MGCRLFRDLVLYGLVGRTVEMETLQHMEKPVADIASLIMQPVSSSDTIGVPLWGSFSSAHVIRIVIVASTV